MIAHIRDRATTSIHERDQAAPTLAFQRRVVPPDPLCCIPFGVALVQLKVVFSRHLLAEVLFLIPVHDESKTWQPYVDRGPSLCCDSPGGEREALSANVKTSDTIAATRQTTA